MMNFRVMLMICWKSAIKSAIEKLKTLPNDDLLIRWYNPRWIWGVGALIPPEFSCDYGNWVYILSQGMEGDLVHYNKLMRRWACVEVVSWDGCWPSESE